MAALFYVVAAKDAVMDFMRYYGDVWLFELGYWQHFCLVHTEDSSDAANLEVLIQLSLNAAQFICEILRERSNWRRKDRETQDPRDDEDRYPAR